jgi:hypothetical protein
VVGHFAKDGLTRRDYFNAMAADQRLLLQKPATVIANVEARMDRYATDPVMRRDYLRAAVAQPALFRTRPESVFATIEAAANRLEAQGFTSSDLPRPAAEPPRFFRHGPEAVPVHAESETSPALPADPQAMPPAIPLGQTAATAPLPSAHVHNPVLYVSLVPAQGRER